MLEKQNIGQTFPKMEIFSSYSSFSTALDTFVNMLLTESTDATSDTMIKIMDVLKWKIGTPHCNGYGILIHAAVLQAFETSVLQCCMVYACFLHSPTKMFELGMLGLQPL